MRAGATPEARATRPAGRRTSEPSAAGGLGRRSTVGPSLSIPSRFNGPLESGNGGYSSGLVAGFLEGAAEVSLRRPVPLDTPLEVVREDDGSVRVLDGEALVAEGRSAPELEVQVPAPVSPDEARLAATRYRAPVDGVFSRCFVCGRAREDAFGVFAGAARGPPAGRLTVDAALVDGRRRRTCAPGVRLGGARLPHLLRAVHGRAAAPERARPAQRADRRAGRRRRGAGGDRLAARERRTEALRGVGRAVARG